MNTVESVSSAQLLKKTDAEEYDLAILGGGTGSEGIGLGLAGVEVTDRGYLKVNERLETTAPGVWAIGPYCARAHFLKHEDS
jgi:pyruvate/2-oxoglutarate dehydrogenase complex dihydrolipoamide dehydrogenase (E3) component